MIEAGVAGGSAAHHADQRRNVASRLVAEAQWLDSVAADERTTATHLNQLSTAHAILHDLKLEGQQGNIDHLIVGPGGAFVVLTRRFNEALVARDGMLFAGDRSLKPEIDAAKATAERLGAVVGVGVVPIIGFHGGILPAAAPQQIDGVYVTAVEYLERVIIRAAHTVLPPHKVTEISERALTLVFNAGSVPRTQVAAAQDEAPATISPWIPTPGRTTPTAAAATAATAAAGAAAADEAVRQREAMDILRQATAPAGGAEVAATPQFQPVPPVQKLQQMQPMQAMQPMQPAQAAQPMQQIEPMQPVTAQSVFAARTVEPQAPPPTSLNELSQMAASAGQGAPAPKPATLKAPAGGRSRGLTITIVLSLCLVAATFGAAFAIMQNHNNDSGTPGASGTTVAGVTGTTTAGLMADGLAAPLVSFSPLCPSDAAGSGWSWVADWPGDLPGLVQYDVEFQNPDGTWTAVAPLTSSAITTVSVAGQGPGVTLVFRITAVMQDGSRSINQSASFTTPASPC